MDTKAKNKLVFTKVTLNDIPRISKYFSFNESRSCDYTIGGLFIWRDYYSSEYSIFNDTIVFKHKLEDNSIIFTYPIGNDVIKCIKLINKYCKNNNLPTKIDVFTNSQITILNGKYKEIKVTQQRDKFDYIYNSSDIINLVGNKYRGQRNHINKFKRNYLDYKFEEINSNNLQELKLFFMEHFSDASKDSPTSIEDTAKAIEVIDNYHIYGLIGGILKVDNNIVAFSVGEKLNDTLYIHIERALLSYHGSYPMLVNTFSKHYVSEEIKYINREDDAGDEGLRKSKMSYRPCAFVEKHCVDIIK